MSVDGSRQIVRWRYVAIADGGLFESEQALLCVGDEYFVHEEGRPKDDLRDRVVGRASLSSERIANTIGIGLAVQRTGRVIENLAGSNANADGLCLVDAVAEREDKILRVVNNHCPVLIRDTPECEPEAEVARRPVGIGRVVRDLLEANHAGRDHHGQHLI